MSPRVLRAQDWEERRKERIQSNFNPIKDMTSSQNWDNYAAHNKHMYNTDSTEADRLFHEQERQRAEERARQEREREERQRREEEYHRQQEAEARARRAAEERAEREAESRRRNRW